jgi:NAD(P)-dependent dehydrogenase (short-subunit alcohol dehydrogenase family)
MDHASTPVSRRKVLIAGATLAATTAFSPAFGQTGSARAQRVAIITGTSSGFGRLMTETFARQGITVIATMRDVDGRNSGSAAEIRQLATEEGLPIEVVEIDVLDETSVRNGVDEAMRLAGHIDILVNNAGIVVPGPVGLQPVDAFAANIETNCNGALRMFRAVAPHMQDRGQGQIIQMSSALGRLLDPLLSGYCASKLAVEAALDAIAWEQERFGIDVSIIQPAGPYPTEFQANGLRYLDEMLDRLPAAERTHADRYDELVDRLRQRLAPNPDLDPQEIAEAAMQLVATEHGSRPRRVVVGPYRDGIERLNGIHETVQAEMLSR